MVLHACLWEVSRIFFFYEEEVAEICYDRVSTVLKKLSDKYPDEMQDGNPIQIGMDGNPYVKAYYSDTVFKWNGQELVESVQFDYGMGEPGGDYQKGSQLAHSGIAYTESYFLTSAHLWKQMAERYIITCMTKRME